MSDLMALYRCFDRAGRLLYVGVSLNPIGRIAQHRGNSRWFEGVARVDIEWLPNRAAAIAAEAVAIARELPLWNVVRPAADLSDADAALLYRLEQQRVLNQQSGSA